MYKDIKSPDIIEALKRQHKDDIWLEELRLSSGFQWNNRIDFYAINVSPSTGNKAVSYEVKISRSDFRRDSEKKQRGARLFSDQFYYIAPEGVIPQEEVPDWAGLIECKWHGSKVMKPYIRMTPVIPAPKLDKEAPSWGLVCSMMRNSARQGGSS